MVLVLVLVLVLGMGMDLGLGLKVAKGKAIAGAMAVDPAVAVAAAAAALPAVPPPPSTVPSDWAARLLAPGLCATDLLWSDLCTLVASVLQTVTCTTCGTSTEWRWPHRTHRL